MRNTFITPGMGYGGLYTKTQRRRQVGIQFSILASATALSRGVRSGGAISRRMVLGQVHTRSRCKKFGRSARALGLKKGKSFLYEGADSFFGSLRWGSEILYAMLEMTRSPLPSCKPGGRPCIHVPNSLSLKGEAIVPVGWVTCPKRSILNSCISSAYLCFPTACESPCSVFPIPSFDCR